MRGDAATRPLHPHHEGNKTLNQRRKSAKSVMRLKGTFAQRNRGLFMLGVSIGGRVSELLALTVGDVWQNNQAVTDFQFDRAIVKGGETSRTIPV